MNKQEILIVILVIALAILYFNRSIKLDKFESNIDFSCASRPYNSNCVCPPDAPYRKVVNIDQNYPYNYGTNSPYKLTCDKNPN